MTHRHRSHSGRHTLSGTRYVLDDLAAASATERGGRRWRRPLRRPRRSSEAPPDLRITRNSIDSLPQPL